VRGFEVLTGGGIPASMARMAGNPSESPRKRRVKSEAEIVLLCNPRAGGRWKELAEIFDSDEAKYARRIVTDSVDDIGSALSDLGRESKLVCIYGGDGTIQRILDRLSPTVHDEIHLALIGGGTMNVTARWCGLRGTPAENFAQVVRGYRSGELLLKEVPLLEVRQGSEVHRGFTFGMGTPVRVLDAYERGRKGKVAAMKLALRSVSAVWTGFPREIAEMADRVQARVTVDGERLPYDEYSVIMGNVTGRINPGVAPFVNVRSRNDFYCVAYAVTTRELVLALPMLIRGFLPIDRSSLLRPIETMRQISRARLSDITFPADPRYINRTASTLEIETDEALYTVDGEVLQSTGEPFRVTLGSTVKLAVSPHAGPRIRIARPIKSVNDDGEAAPEA
jgi:diacylglycerol kinase family enzyme